MTPDPDRDRIVAARMRLRERFLARIDATPSRADARPLGSGPPNRHGMPKIPPDQTPTAPGKWPVLDLGGQPNLSLERWRLRLEGACRNPATLRWEDFLALEQVEDTSDFHCVTTWSRFDNRWAGVRFRTLAELAVPAPEARFVLCTGYDHAPGTRIPYTTNLPLARAVEDDVLLVHTWEWEALQARKS